MKTIEEGPRGGATDPHHIQGLDGCSDDAIRCGQRVTRRLFPRFSAGEDVGREIRAHLEMLVEELVGEGWDPDEAWVEARSRFGDEGRIRRQCRSLERRHLKKVRRTEMLDGTLQDFKYGIRTLLKSPAFALVAIVTLALGIGANATVFSLVNGVLLKPLSFDDPEGLVWVAERSHRGYANNVAWANFRDWRTESRSFRGLAAFQQRSTTILGGDQPVYGQVAAVSQDFWSVFRVAPRVGRLSLAEDHVEGGAPVAVVSQTLANQVLGGREAVGKRLEVAGIRYEVVGLVPSSFDFPVGTHVWTPTELTPKSQSRSSHNWRVVGRLAEGVTVEAAVREMDPLTVRLVATAGENEAPEYLAVGTVITSLRDTLVGDTRRPLLLLMGAAAFVLLVACTNLASTLLARGTTRARELAVRSAIGASRTRIVRQLLSEAGLMAVLGGVAGIGLTQVILRGVKATAAGSIPRLEGVGLDGTVLLFTLAVTLLTAIAFGLLPALRARENDQAGTLRNQGRGNEGYRGRIWGTLVAAEVALALVLVTGSGLLIRSFSAVVAQDPGIDGEDVVVSMVAPSGIKYPEEADHRRFWEDMLVRAEAMPGVSRAGVLSTLPISGSIPNGLVHLNGDPLETGDGGYVLASPGVFEALDIPLLQGRVFDETDLPGGPEVVVVSRSFAETYWPGEDPLGKLVSAGGMDGYSSMDSPLFGTVIGVVADVRYRDLTRAGESVVYWSYRQRPHRIQYGGHLVVESASGDPAMVAEALGREIQAADPDVAPRIRFLREAMAESLGERRFTLLVMSAFAAVGLLLAALGIFGVVSYAVAQRSREMGIRLALGASGGMVRSMVLRHAMVPVVLGVLVGTGGAWGLSRIMSGLLFQVTPTDPITFLGVSSLLLATGLIASWVPTVRGTRVDPMITMGGD
jgi:predicted permease